ncbi:hypothetical protein [Streptomyces sp. URMC 129]|uniref:hypothetical protein n=1 Tax=Streptomyces sp. URMC 129 TaxID=3423407 RepID=UPI003F192C4C
MSIRFENPPTGQRKKPGVRSIYMDAARELRQRRGEWAIITTASTLADARVRASYLKRESPAFLPREEWELKAATNHEGEHCVYARYIGGEEK